MLGGVMDTPQEFFFYSSVTFQGLPVLHSEWRNSSSVFRGAVLTVFL